MVQVLCEMMSPRLHERYQLLPSQYREGFSQVHSRWHWADLNGFELVSHLQAHGDMLWS